MTVHVSGGFNIDIYVDINGQWASGDRASQIVWDFHQQQLGKDKALKTWEIRRATEQLFSEVRDQAEWGTLHFSAPSVRPSTVYCVPSLTDATRMFVMSRALRDLFARVSRVLVLFRTPLTKTSGALWRKSLSLRSPSRSA